MKMNFDNIDTNQITLILKTGDLSSLDQDHQEYYSMMDVVRGLRARMTTYDKEKGERKVITKAGIIKLLKVQYGLTDYMARKVYADAINFFYSRENITSDAFANLYAERLEKWADAAFLMGKADVAGKLIKEAATLRGCYKPKDNTIPEELLNQKPITIYTSTNSDLGVEDANRAELKEFLESMPGIPTLTMERVKADAGIKKFNIVERMTQDIDEFTEETPEAE